MLFAAVGDQIVGRVHIRHALPPYLLRVGGHIGYAVRPKYRRRGYATTMMQQWLEVLRGLDIQQSLVTCYDDNAGSIKRIERCGGVMENTVDISRVGPSVVTGLISPEADQSHPGPRSTRGKGHSVPGRLRVRLISERRRLPSSRRRREPCVGRVRRRINGGTTASRSSVTSRCLAAARFCRWDRCSEALMVTTVPETRSASRSRTRSR